MLQSLTKTVMLLATVAAVPYTVALISNILYGWPPKNKYKRALNLRKVLAMNYTCLQLLYRNCKYAPLWLRWTSFYRSMNPKYIRKNLAYGTNEQTLDLYLPQGVDPSQPRPVIIFIYGGAWSSGNKKMYGLLCTEIANKLKCLVCCPNYSLYPQGYVDDMAQDVVDCVSWINQNVGEYGGDQSKILLMGHSAGAHLCMLAVLELLHEELMKPSEGTSQLENIRIKFEESHFNGTQKTEKANVLEQSSGSTSSFVVLNDNGEKGDLSTSASLFEQSTSVETVDVINSEQNIQSEDFKTVDTDESQTGKDTACAIEESMVLVEKEGEVSDEDVVSNESSVETVLQNDVDKERSLAELGKSIKAVIGLAGVYNIADHYEHESSRGIEDVSRMARAMYGSEHFDRFSPSLLCHNIVNSSSLPKIVLVHGTEDSVVPLASTTKLAESLTEKFADITVRILPGCDHYEICLDLMKSNRKFYETVMSIIMETSSKVFQ